MYIKYKGKNEMIDIGYVLIGGIWVATIATVIWYVHSLRQDYKNDRLIDKMIKKGKI